MEVVRFEGLDWRILMQVSRGLRALGEFRV